MTPSCTSHPQSKKQVFFASPKQSMKRPIQTGKRDTIQFCRMSGDARLTSQSHPKRLLLLHYACRSDPFTLQSVLHRRPVITDSGILHHPLYPSFCGPNLTLGYGSKGMGSSGEQKKGTRRRNGGDRSIRHSQVVLSHVFAIGQKTTVKKE